MASNPLECKICYNVFSEDHCPRFLPCSHSFCGPCIDGLILAKKSECPVCRTTFMANSAENVAINRDLLDAAKQLSSMHLASRPSTDAPKKSILEFTKDFRENVIGKSITVCQETEAEVKARIESDNEMRKGLEGFIQTLEEMKLSSGKSLTNIGQDHKELMNKLDVMQKEQLNMKESERKLEEATDFASAGATMDEAGQILHDTNKTVSHVKQLLQENDRRRDDMRQDTLRIRGAFTDAMNDFARVTTELEGDSVVKITVTDLRILHVCLSGDAPKDIFATKSYAGTLRVAPVKMESNNQASLTHLQEGVLPPRCFVIELESLMQWSPSPSPSPSPPPSSPPRAFLDLVYESTPLGRVIIRVTENGLKGLNFLHMCAGGMGPSYAHSHVSSVGWKGGAGESVFMGQYVPHGGGGGGGGGTSTRAVLSSREEDWERESGSHKQTPWKAGEVMGYISYEGASKFWIVTRDHPSWDRGYCFGMVEEGLDVLRTTILKHPGPDIKRVRVGECGLIL